MSATKVSLIVTTYNWPEALASVLRSIKRQSMLPVEVIIADDGSNPATRMLIEQTANNFPCALHHIWQQDLGFRVARCRNLAIAASSGDLLVLLDGDMVLHPRFIEDHCNASRQGYFIQGSRVLLVAAGSQKLLTNTDTTVTFFSPGIKRRRNTLRLPLLSKLWRLLSAGQKRGGIKTCNQSWWRTDLVKLNGFDERMISWGKEDDELAARAFHAGLIRQDVKYSALAFHIWHQERHHDGKSPNQKYLDETNALAKTWAENGLDKHLSHVEAIDNPDLRLKHKTNPIS